MSVGIEYRDGERPNASVRYGRELLYFKKVVRISDVPRIKITVRPDCTVEVAAPATACDRDVLAAVEKRGRWIYKKLQQFKSQQQYLSAREYISGESHYYLGRQYMLKVDVDPDRSREVKLLRGRLLVCLPEPDSELVKTMMVDWYKARAKVVFKRKLESMLSQTLWVSDQPDLHIVNMKTQWGSCSPNGRLTLNSHLVKAPGECIDYVILHELCHIAEHNHSDRFYRLMSQVMPNYQVVKLKLDSMAHRFLM